MIRFRPPHFIIQLLLEGRSVDRLRQFHQRMLISMIGCSRGRRRPVSYSSFLQAHPRSDARLYRGKFSVLCGPRACRTNQDPRLVAVLNDWISQDVDMVTVRFNYRFGGWGAPVAARY